MVTVRSQAAIRNKPSITIVVIGLNEEPNLPRCFSSIKVAIANASQNLGCSSIVYVDSGSTDESVEVARTYGAQIYQLVSPPSAAAARMVGLDVATTEWILFLDGDMELHPNWLNVALIELTERNERHYVGAIGIRDDVYVDEKSRIINVRENVYRVCRVRRAPHFGGAVLIESTALRKVGGYRPELRAGEEPDLYGRLLAQGMKVIELPVPFVRHYTPPPPGRLQRLRQLLGTRPHMFFADTFWSAVSKRYLQGIAQVYRYTFGVWVFDSLSLISSLFWGFGAFVLVQFLLVVWLSLTKRVQEFFLGRWRLAAVVQHGFHQLMLGNMDAPGPKYPQYIKVEASTLEQTHVSTK